MKPVNSRIRIVLYVVGRKGHQCTTTHGSRALVEAMPNCLSAFAGGEKHAKETCLPACLHKEKRERERKLLIYYWSTVKKKLILIWR
jgi:hypothetical protein